MKRTHHTALSELYKSKGVGRTVAQRLKFWESQEPGCNFSHNPTDAQKVGCFGAVLVGPAVPEGLSILLKVLVS